MITAGHCEQKSLQEINLPSDKLQLHVTYHASQLNAEALKGIDVLMVGNAWGNFSDAEIATVENFVKNGGGLMAVGWGWRAGAGKPMGISQNIINAKVEMVSRFPPWIITQ